MSIDTSLASAGDAATLRVSLPRVIRAEWTKLITTRITLITMVVIFGVMSAGSVLIGFISPFDTEGATTNLATHATLHAALFTPMAVGVLGILTITIEYSSGTIRTTLLAVPKRTPVLLAKAIVVTVVAFVLVATSSLIAFEVGRLSFASQGLDLSPVDPESMGIVFGGSAALAAFALLSFAIGALVRNTAGAVTIWMILLYVVPSVLVLAGGSIGEAVFSYLPTTLAASIGQETDSAETFAAGPALAILFGYGVIGTVAAMVLLRRRDA